MIPAIVGIALGAGAVSAGLGGLIRQYLLKEKDPWAPEKVATDFAFGAIAGPVTAGTSSVLAPLATSGLRTALVSGTSAAVGVGVADLAEDYLRPAIYQAFGKAKELGEAYPVPEKVEFHPERFKPNILMLSPVTLPAGLLMEAPQVIDIKWKQPEGTEPPKPHPEELLVSVPLGFGLGALVGYGYYKYAEGKLWIPKLGKVSPDTEHTWVGLYRQAGYKAEPVFGVSKEGTKTVKLPLVNKEIKVPNLSLVKGAPNWERINVQEFSQWSEAGGYVPKSPIERALVEEPLKRSVPPKEATKLEILKVTDKTYTLDTPAPQKEAFYKALKESPRLRDVADDLMAWLEKQRDIFGIIRAKPYGSIVQKAYVGEAMTRTPADLDLSVPNPEKAAKELVQIFRSKGVPVRLNPQHPTLIERYMNGQWVHMIDIHSEGSLLAPYGSQGYIGWGYAPKQPKYINIGKGKMPVMSIEEQGVRKVASTLQVWKEGRIAPVPHRIKDIRDAYEVQKWLVQQLPEKEQKPLLDILEQWINAWSDILSPSGIVKGARELAAIYVRSVPYPYPIFYSPYFPGFMSSIVSQVSETSKSPEAPSPEASKPSPDTSQPSGSPPSPPPSSPPPSSPPPSAPSISPSVSPPPSPSLPSASLPSPSSSISPSTVYYSVSISPSPVFYAPPSVPVFGRIYVPAPAPPPGGPKAHANLPTKWVWEI